MEILKHINNVLPTRMHILLAVSGGLDSMVLLDILQYTNLYVSVIHANFQLRRNDSHNDELFLKNFCKCKKIPFYKKRFKIKNNRKKSIQMIARNLRYSWFFSILKEIDAGYIVSAHHLDDAIETFYINLFRSSGLKGLISITEWSKFLLRPLLLFSKIKILQYAKYYNIWWREDLSNKNSNFLRNSIRIDLISQFYNKNSKTLFYLRNDYILFQQSIVIIFTLITVIFVRNVFYWEINIAKFRALNPLKNYIYNFLYPYGFKKFLDIEKLLYSSTGKQIFSKKYKLLNNHNRLVLTTRKIKKTLLINFFFEINDFIDQKAFISLDFSKITWPLFLRKYNKDKILVNILNNKKISKFFKKSKLNFFEKEEIFILTDVDKAIIWLINFGLNFLFKITIKTNVILNIF